MERDRRTPADKFPQIMERSLMLSSEQGMKSFILKGPVQDLIDYPIWVGYFPHGLGQNFPALAAGGADNTPMTVGFVYSLVSDLEVPEDIEPVNLIIHIGDHEVMEFSDEMPIAAIVIGQSHETGEQIVVLRAVEGLAPKEALDQLKKALRKNLVSQN